RQLQTLLAETQQLITEKRHKEAFGLLQKAREYPAAVSKRRFLSLFGAVMDVAARKSLKGALHIASVDLGEQPQIVISGRRFAAVVSQNKVKMLRLPSLSEVGELAFNSDVLSAAFTLQDEALFVGTIDGSVTRFGLKEGSRQRVCQLRCPCYRIVPDWSLKGGCYITTTGEVIRFGENGNAIEQVAKAREHHIDTCVPRSGRFALRAYARQNVELTLLLPQQVHTPRRVDRVQPGGHKLLFAALSPEGRHGFLAAEDGAVYAWDLFAGKAIQRAIVTKGKATCLAAACGAIFAVGDDSGFVRLFKSGENRPVARLITSNAPVSSICFSQNSAFLLVAKTDKKLELWLLDWETDFTHAEEPTKDFLNCVCATMHALSLHATSPLASEEVLENPTPFVVALRETGVGAATPKKLKKAVEEVLANPNTWMALTKPMLHQKAAVVPAVRKPHRRRAPRRRRRW
ncbi:MAG: hypothetical protein DRP63_04955, partial [Planctomycetota bacterium]